MNKYLSYSKQSGLTDSHVLDIRRLGSTGKTTVSQLASSYNVSEHTITQILKGKSWKHVPSPVTIKSKPNYSILPDGRVWSNATGKFIRQIVRKNGKRVVSLKQDGKRTYADVAELVASAYVKTNSRKRNITLNYRDGNMSNVHFTNLELS